MYCCTLLLYACSSVPKGWLNAAEIYVQYNNSIRFLTKASRISWRFVSKARRLTSLVLRICVVLLSIFRFALMALDWLDDRCSYQL